MTILVIDNYDSFAYNLVQYVGEAVETMESVSDFDSDPQSAVVVRRNDEIDADDIRALDPDGIVVSPGPGTPAEAGVSVSVFSDLDYPSLGVCLGHQALCAANGVRVGHAPNVIHGKPSTITHDGRGVFDGIPSQIEVGRYHSLAVTDDLPDCLIETARTDDKSVGGNVIMGVRHCEKPHAGVQFHPESILTDAGKRMIKTFCRQSISK
jgi:anthranilate synthase component 2